ncbi:ribosome-associated complex subunit SSZ1 [Aspergillus udagawae]|uniref:Hsp70 protein that interacts with Zuo1p n=1 Tax=Aspergillus udagawae TaxID=91492 RepID=A0A8E0UVR6_9EURO|nr:hsp70 protein that interacts with Zuo1p [Aspergillus udagawae]GFF49538.1 ribosome-associated complex subunit SSZ1 [Aspergillus udagawae]GFF88705.1 ribosome-associated complex subunit SSZ1 [Aspergillus udagawae]GFG15137.1 ribosome-associated complex subunit SSZ1 [Aspergillus udagawae]GFG23671.1 ribosome-associated complex subunit SSZ1 [Aspergillus udagawae]GIC84536.1 hsp70 protein that interacts with Zuo1p [Aspergillus udagawae]
MGDSNGVAAETAERFAIGISFGNSSSSIARLTPEGKAEVIANEEGDRQIPTVLSYIDGEEYHGTQAKAQLVRNPQNTVAYFRDYVGKSFKSIDPTPCHQSAHPQQVDSTVAFTIRDTSSETPNSVTVSEITTRHLRRLKQSASDYLGKDVNAAVITVPTDFTDAQREALIAAAGAAGLEVLQLIHEPVAAVLAYDARPEAVVTDKLVVVADLGGTRSDAAVIACRGGMYTILATAHDYELGGATLDQIVIDHFAKEFIKKHKTDPRENARGLAKLKLEGEATRRALSLGTNASLSIESLADGIDFSSTINRTRYELLSGKVFAQFTRLIEQVVQKAELDVLDIDEVIFSGGTSHTPKIAQLVRNMFPEKTQILAPSTSASAINPSELAPRGAAIQASLIQEFDKEDIEQSIHPMVTATPHLRNAIGVEFVHGETVEFKPLLNAETALPARRIAQYSAPKDGGDVLVRVCEGVREIKVTKPEPKPKEDKPAKAEDDEDEDSDFDSDEDEEEEIREIVWKTEKPIAELAVKGVKAGSKVELMVHVNADLGMQITAREVGGQNAVRGAVESPKA